MITDLILLLLCTLRLCCVLFQVQPHRLLWRGQCCSWLLLCRFRPPYFIFIKPVFLRPEFIAMSSCLHIYSARYNEMYGCVWDILAYAKPISGCCELAFFLFPFPFSQWYLHSCVWYMMLCNYGWVYLSKSIALTFLFWNLFQDFSIRYSSVLMLVNYCCIHTLDTYYPVLIYLLMPHISAEMVSSTSAFSATGRDDHQCTLMIKFFL
jgi:hypothetical protein